MRPFGVELPDSGRIPLPTLLVFAVLALPASGQAGEFGVNVYGLSYHLDRARARELCVDNEVNTGLGVRYRLLQSGASTGSSTPAPTTIPDAIRPSLQAPAHSGN